MALHRGATGRLRARAALASWPAAAAGMPISIASSRRPRRSPAGASSRCRRSSPTRLSPTPTRTCARRSCRWSAGGAAGVRPDSHRNREFLEQFSLDTLKMVGTLNLDGKLLRSGADQGRPRAPRAASANTWAQNDGKITDITPTKIALIEIIPDGLGGYIERPAAPGPERMIGREIHRMKRSIPQMLRGTHAAGSPCCAAAGDARGIGARAADASADAGRGFCQQAAVDRRADAQRQAAAADAAPVGPGAAAARRSRSTSRRAFRSICRIRRLRCRRAASTSAPGGVDTVLAAEANGRTRVVLNLDQPHALPDARQRQRHRRAWSAPRPRPRATAESAMRAAAAARAGRGRSRRPRDPQHRFSPQREPAPDGWSCACPIRARRSI